MRGAAGAGPPAGPPDGGGAATRTGQRREDARRGRWRPPARPHRLSPASSPSDPQTGLLRRHMMLLDRAANTATQPESIGNGHGSGRGVARGVSIGTPGGEAAAATGMAASGAKRAEPGVKLAESAPCILVVGISGTGAAVSQALAQTGQVGSFILVDGHRVASDAPLGAVFAPEDVGLARCTAVASHAGQAVPPGTPRPNFLKWHAHVASGEARAELARVLRTGQLPRASPGDAAATGSGDSAEQRRPPAVSLCICCAPDLATRQAVREACAAAECPLLSYSAPPAPDRAQARLHQPMPGEVDEAALPRSRDEGFPFAGGGAPASQLTVAGHVADAALAFLCGAPGQDLPALGWSWSWDASRDDAIRAWRHSEGDQPLWRSAPVARTRVGRGQEAHKAITAAAVDAPPPHNAAPALFPPSLAAPARRQGGAGRHVRREVQRRMRGRRGEEQSPRRLSPPIAQPQPLSPTLSPALSPVCRWAEGVTEGEERAGEATWQAAPSPSPSLASSSLLTASSFGASSAALARDVLGELTRRGVRGSSPDAASPPKPASSQGRGSSQVAADLLANLQRLGIVGQGGGDGAAGAPAPAPALSSSLAQWGARTPYKAASPGSQRSQASPAWPIAATASESRSPQRPGPALALPQRASSRPSAQSNSPPSSSPSSLAGPGRSEGGLVATEAALPTAPIAPLQSPTRPQALPLPRPSSRDSAARRRQAGPAGPDGGAGRAMPDHRRGGPLLPPRELPSASPGAAHARPAHGTSPRGARSAAAGPRITAGGRVLAHPPPRTPGSEHGATRRGGGHAYAPPPPVTGEGDASPPQAVALARAAAAEAAAAAAAAAATPQRASSEGSRRATEGQAPSPTSGRLRASPAAPPQGPAASPSRRSGWRPTARPAGEIEPHGAPATQGASRALDTAPIASSAGGPGAPSLSSPSTRAPRRRQRRGEAEEAPRGVPALQPMAVPADALVMGSVPPTALPGGGGGGDDSVLVMSEGESQTTWDDSLDASLFGEE